MRGATSIGMRAICNPETSNCGGGGGTPQKNVYVTNIKTAGVCDNGLCFEGNEFEWKATKNGVPTGVRVYRTGIPSTTTYDPSQGIDVNGYKSINAILTGSGPDYGEIVYVEVNETDWPEADDHWRWFDPAGGWDYIPLHYNDSGRAWYLVEFPCCVDDPRVVTSFNYVVTY